MHKMYGCENPQKNPKNIVKSKDKFSGHHLGGSHARRHQDRGEEGPKPQGEDLPQGKGSRKKVPLL